MAGQFEKFVKILGTGSRPDRAVGTWTGENKKGGPKGSKAEIVIPPAVVNADKTDDSGKDTNITQAAVNVAKGRREDIAARDLELQRKELRGNAAKRQAKGLSTTTMRLDESTGEAYDLEDRRPEPSGRVMPTRKANPKYLAADAQRANEDLAAATEADRRNSGVIPSDERVAEEAWNKSQKSGGSTLRSINGITFDMSEWEPDKRPTTHDLRNAEWGDTQDEAKAKAYAKYGRLYGGGAPATTVDSTVVPTKPLNSKMADTRDEEIEPEEDKRPIDVQVQHKVVREYEQKSKGPTKVEYGDTLSEKNKTSSFTEPRESKVVDQPVYKRPEKMYVENDPEKMFGHLTDEQYADRAENADILSTTMREVQPEGPAAPVGKRKVKVVSPRSATPYKKPEVAKTGNVIPQNVLDTYIGSTADVDITQAELENKNLRENRTNPTTTSPYDPNKTPERDTFGRTPEGGLTQAARREQRAAELAAQGKSMTTVDPKIMSTAKAIAATSRFGYQKDDPFFETTGFLDHPAIQEATIAHAFGVHHDVGILHRALGGRAPEIARRRNAWFKVAQRKLRNQPEKIKGEYDTLGAAIRKGTPPTTVVRKLERGDLPGITVNGTVPTLAPDAPIADVKTPTRAATRRMHANTAANIMFQQQQAAKEAHRIMTFEPLKTTTMRLNEATGEAYDSDNPDELLKNTVLAAGKEPGIAKAGTDMVTVSNKNNPNQKPVTRPFTPAERANKKNVPGPDDSKSRLAASKDAPTESTDIITRLNKGRKSDE